MILTVENIITQRKTCPLATLFATNPTWSAVVMNLNLHGEKATTNHLSYGMTLSEGYLHYMTLAQR
jgi:hypothetical protein